MFEKDNRKYREGYNFIKKGLYLISNITLKPKILRDKESNKIGFLYLIKIIKNRILYGNFVKKVFINHIIDKIYDPKVILELGSRDGIQSIEFSKIFPKAKIYAFECYPPCIEMCIKNTRKYKNIKIVKNAVFNKDCNINFYSFSDNIGTGSIFKINKKSPISHLIPKKEIKVKATRIDTWAKENNIERIDLLWVDLQGAEYEAFEGMGKYLSNIQAIYTEVEKKEFYLDQKLMKDISELLNKYGFYLLKYSKIGKDLWGNAIYINRTINKIKFKYINSL